MSSEGIDMHMFTSLLSLCNFYEEPDEVKEILLRELAFFMKRAQENCLNQLQEHMSSWKSHDQMLSQRRFLKKRMKRQIRKFIHYAHKADNEKGHRNFEAANHPNPYDLLRSCLQTSLLL